MAFDCRCCLPQCFPRVDPRPIPEDPAISGCCSLSKLRERPQTGDDRDRWHPGASAARFQLGRGSHRSGMIMRWSGRARLPSAQKHLEKGYPHAPGGRILGPSQPRRGRLPRSPRHPSGGASIDAAEMALRSRRSLLGAADLRAR